MTNLIILNDLPTYDVPSKTAGAYRIASSCRQHGHSVNVLDHFSYFVDNDPESFFKILSKQVTNETYALAVSGTWFSGLNFAHRKIVSGDKDLYEGTGQHSDAKWFNCFYKLFSYIKENHPELKILLGGHSSGSVAIYNIFGKAPFDFIDYWVKGFGESSMIQFLNNCKSNIPNPVEKIIPGDPMGLLYDFHNCPPMFSENDVILANETLPLELSRGCRFKCKFCSYPLLGKNPKEHRYLRSKESIKKELRFNYDNWGTTNYFVLCDTFNETNEKLQTLADVVDELKIDLNITAYIRLDLVYAHYEKQIPLLKKVGLRFANFGIESLNDPSAKAIGKGMGKNKTIKALAMMKNAWNNNIHLHGNFVVGLPYETKDTIEKNNKELVDGLIGLDSFTWHSLSIVRNRGKTRSFSSEFDRNYKEYGYDVFENNKPGKNGDAWRNEHWDSFITDDLSRQWNDNARLQNKSKLDAWRMASILNYGFTYKEAFSKYHTDLSSAEFQHNKKVFLNKYIEKVKEKFL